MTDAELDLASFWRGLGAESATYETGSFRPSVQWDVDGLIVADGPEGSEKWLDPFDADKVGLETLIDGCRKLAPDMEIAAVSVQGWGDIWSISQWTAREPTVSILEVDLRAALIAAILKLEADNEPNNA